MSSSVARAGSCRRHRSAHAFGGCAAIVVWSLGALLSSACSTPSGEDVAHPERDAQTSASPTVDGSAGSGDAVAEAASPGACDVNEVSLTLTFDEDSLVDSQLVPVTTARGDGWLSIDTGSAGTFVYGPDSTTKQPITIGCETLRVISRDFEAEMYDGKPILGVLGSDFFVSPAIVADFDYPKHRIARHAKGAPAGVDSYVDVPYLDAGGHIAVRAEVDGLMRVLLWDTGSGHTLLVPELGRDTDTKVPIGDVSGAVIDAWIGPSEIVFGGETKQLPTYRVPKWPYFESYQKTLLPDLAGLFGRSSMGFRRIVIDGKARRLRLGPIEEAK